MLLTSVVPELWTTGTIILSAEFGSHLASEVVLTVM